MLQRKVPDAVCDVLYGASLTALEKKDGGLRPITVGNTLRRLTGRIVARRVGREMEGRVHPEHVGCGTRGGAEAAVHPVRSFLEEGKNESRVLLKLDFRNATNTIHRDGLLRVVREVLPAYHAFVWQTYRHNSKLLFGQHIMESARDVQQGDPLGPLLFCLVIESITKTLKSPLNLWYLDDGTIGGEIGRVLSDLLVVVEEGRKVGLEFDPSTCELSANDLSLLGAPSMEQGLEDAVRAK
ncbi:hypothetical protein RvY_03094 [Ramazzottius varieornatus]|uniref:Reverse transcriptase domain-containing protein n=1 Tax=Ramazzottius varieornatus TaxID=947166 RepID=A0A1D1ULW3_RAMVA|nr:hypothetical protein RvY_03094 [Ramazzottius varieornatus]